MTTSPLASSIFAWTAAASFVWPGAIAQHSWGVARSPDAPSAMSDYDSSDRRTESTHMYSDSYVDASSATSSNSIEFDDSGSRIAHPWGGMDSGTNDHVATMDSTTTEATRFKPNLSTDNDDDVSQGHQRHAWNMPNYKSYYTGRPESSREENDLAQVKKGWNFPPLSEQRRGGKTASEVTRISLHVVRTGYNDNDNEKTL